MNDFAIRELVKEFMNVNLSEDGNKTVNLYNVSGRQIIDAIKAAYQSGYDRGNIDGYNENCPSE